MGSRRVNSCSVTFDLTTLGEAVLRYMPVVTTAEDKDKCPDGEMFVRTVAGAEINVSVALSRLGMSTSWVSVLPEGDLGNSTFSAIKKTGVDMRWCKRVPGADVGIQHVVPEERAVCYQRKNSAFASMQSTEFDWFTIASSCRWIHVTGISPFLGSAPDACWQRLVREGAGLRTPISIDLNHRPALASLGRLMYFMMEFLPMVQLFVVSRSSAIELVRMLLSRFADQPDESVLEEEGVLCALRTELKCPLVAVACSQDDESNPGSKLRWSLVSCKAGFLSTREQRRSRIVREHLGGGDAWVAGFLNAILSTPGKTTNECLDDMDVLKRAALRGDLLAGLQQETLGDFSTVTSDQLLAAEAERT